MEKYAWLEKQMGKPLIDAGFWHIATWGFAVFSSCLKEHSYFPDLSQVPEDKKEILKETIAQYYAPYVKF